MIAKYLLEETENKENPEMLSNEEISENILKQVGIRERLKDVKKLFLIKDDTFSKKPVYSLKLVDHSWGVHFRGKEFIILAYSWASNFTYHDEVGIFKSSLGRYHFYDAIKVSAVHSWKNEVKHSSGLAREIAANLSRFADSSKEEMDKAISEVKDGTLGDYILTIE